MKGLLEQYGVAIFTIVLMAILIAMAGPFGIRIKEYMLEKANYTHEIGTDEMNKETNKDKDDDTQAMSSIYACLYTNGELVLSATPIDNTGRTDIDTDFGKCELKELDFNSQEPPVKWIANPKIKTVNIINKIKPTNCNGWFHYCSNLTEIKNIKNIDTSACTNMSYMFNGCSNLTQLDVSNFNTSACTNMSYMFYECSNLTQLDVNKFNTSTCTNMSNMFGSCRDLTQLDVSKFNTSACTDMSSMFSDCGNLTQLDIRNFDTSNCTNMESMFSGIEVYNMPNFFVGYDVSSCIDENSNSKTQDNLKQYFREHVFDMSKVTNDDDMFNWID